MSFGIIEIITLLLGMSGFGLQPNAKAPTPDAALQYAMPSPDVVLHADAQSVIPGNYRVLSRLADQPTIKASPELSKAVRKMINEIEGARGLAKSMTGIDFTTDIHDATVFLQLVPGAQPHFVAAVRGKFTPRVIEKIAGVTRKPAQKIGGGVMLDMGADEPALALTRDGVLLAGTANLVRARLENRWQAPPRAPGSVLAHTAEVIAARPVFAAVAALSPAARKEAFKELATKDWGPNATQPKLKGNFATDLLQRHKLAALSVFHDGVGWSWIDSSRAGLDSFVQMSEGVIDLLRAGQVAPRGIAKVLMGAIDSYRGTSRQVDDLIRRKAELMKIVESYTGDGNFKVAFDRQPAQNRLNVRATGKSLSDVVPAGFFLPIAAAGALLAEAKHEDGGPAMPAPKPTGLKQPARPVPAPPPPPAPRKY